MDLTPLFNGDRTAFSSAVGTAAITVQATPDAPRKEAVYITAPIDLAKIQTDTTTVSGTVDPAFSQVWVNGVEAVVSNGTFAVSGIPLVPGANRLTVTASNGSETAFDRITVVRDYDYTSQPTHSFGARYEHLVPEDAMKAEYDPERFSIVTGEIIVDGGTNTDIRVSVHGYPEYGSTLTSDTGEGTGRFSLPVHGGTTLTLVYKRSDLITVHRKIWVPVNDIAVAETARMIQLNPSVTSITFNGDPNTVLAHRTSDTTGTRFCTLRTLDLY